MSEVISIDESRRLMELERRIQRGLDTFMEVGEALLEIRESRLYRIEHGTFEEYCRSKWGMNPRYANRVIGAALVIENLGPMGPNPTTERQARPLTKLPPEDQPVAWEKAVDLADGKQPTAKLVEQVVAGMLAPEVEEEIPEEDRRAIEECMRDVQVIEAREAMLEKREEALRSEYRYAFEARELLHRVSVVLTQGFQSGNWKDFSGAESSVVGQMQQLIERIEKYENAK
jgi:hypothetical protein